MTWWNRPNLKHLDGILCDGAVRSGKTMALTCGFFLWSMATFDRQVFALCGKTVGALRRNLLLPMGDWLGSAFHITENRSENRLTVRLGNRVNTYYLFGGQDESAYTLIQGITLAGALLDEAVLMPRSFVEQAAARCSVEGAKLWFSCNPGSREHWFYRSWVCKAKEKRMLRLHFTMDDNPALSENVKARYKRLYTGVFYRRYVLGQWCAAEGRVYDFDENRHVVDVAMKTNENLQKPTRSNANLPISGEKGQNDIFRRGFEPTKTNENLQKPTRSDKNRRGLCNVPNDVEKCRFGDGTFRQRAETSSVTCGDSVSSRRSLWVRPWESEGKWYISVDYGTYNPFSAGLWYVRGGVAVRVREYYHDGRQSGVLRTDEEYYRALERLAGEHPVERIIIDPSAASLIALIRRRGRFSVRKAQNQVLPGIRLVGSLLQQGRLLIGSQCHAAIREFSLYCWQDDETRDVPKKENDHAMDDIRYFCMSVMRRWVSREALADAAISAPVGEGNGAAGK